MRLPSHLLLCLGPLSACASMSSPKPGDDVVIASNLSSQEASTHEDMGAIQTTEVSVFLGDEADAIARLRYIAFRRGVDLIVLPKVDRNTCELNHEQQCVTLRGRAYKRRK